MLVVRRSVDYGGDRLAASYLIEGANGNRFAKCSIYDARTFSKKDKATNALRKAKQNDPYRHEARYEIVSL